MTSADLDVYASELVADVQASAEAESMSPLEAFTRRVLEDLERAGEVENTFVAFYTSRGAEASGYGDNQSIGSLDIFVSYYRPIRETLSRSQLEAISRRPIGFLKRCKEGLADQLDDATDERDMAEAIEKLILQVQAVRIFVLTNAVVNISSLADGDFQGVPVKFQVWDLARLHRLASSGTLSEPIVVDFAQPLPCLVTPTVTGDYSVFLAIAPGALLAELYGRFGTRLLELNVRSFLQARGSVNRGIRSTLLNEPDRFLAYNNGITATASQVEFAEAPSSSGTAEMVRLHDFQIVNGGQTTASLHYAHTRDRAVLDNVFVQMKLTVVSPDRLDQIVPEISKYSNTQNKVTVVDISSNHPFHVSVERVTRSLWAPAADGGGQETRWFYERARGQYADALARERTPSAQRRFKLLHPPAQKFTKADAAKYLNSWGQLPHVVSRGAEKNFYQFMSSIADSDVQVDSPYCRRLIAKSILFKTTDRIVASKRFGGYKINITAYTVSKIVAVTSRRLDLEQIWKDQSLSASLRAELETLCQHVHEVITTPPRAGTNIGEWAKRPECWAAVHSIPWTPSEELEAELLDVPADDIASSMEAVEAEVAQVRMVPAAEWAALAEWAKESQNLQPWERQTAESISRYLTNDWKLTKKLATQALRILEQAQEFGFRN